MAAFTLGVPAARAGSPPAAPAAREAWLDVARGMTILLVVLLHADLMLGAVGERAMVLHLVALVLYPLRMPLFFLVAGMLAAGMLARPAAHILTDRVAFYAWVWAVWTALGYGVVNSWIIPATPLENVGALFGPRTDPAEHLLTSSSWAWFLYALALFFATALLLRRLPPGVHLVVAMGLAVPGVFAWGHAAGLGVLDRFYHYPYFVAGWLGAGWLRRLVPRLASWRTVLPLALAWAAATIAAHASGWLDTPPGRFALSVLAVPTALLAAQLIAVRSRLLASPLVVLGTSTLVIYLLHPWILLVLVHPARPPAVPAAGWALALIVLASVLPVLVEPALRRVPGLIEPPWQRRRPRR